MSFLAELLIHTCNLKLSVDGRFPKKCNLNVNTDRFRFSQPQAPIPLWEALKQEGFLQLEIFNFETFEKCQIKRFSFAKNPHNSPSHHHGRFVLIVICHLSFPTCSTFHQRRLQSSNLLEIEDYLLIHLYPANLPSHL